MTQKEAINVLRTESIELGGSAVSVCRFWEALDMAVKALEDVTDKNVGKMTNADRIRAMTDEELVNFLMRLMGHAQCFAEGIFPYHPCPQNYNCKQCGIDWLQQTDGWEDRHETD